MFNIHFPETDNRKPGIDFPAGFNYSIDLAENQLKKPVPINYWEPGQVFNKLFINRKYSLIYFEKSAASLG
jgi:hypothetical protein